MLQWPAQVRPAIGQAGRLPRKVAIRRSAVALGLLILLGLAKLVVSHLEDRPDTLSALPGDRAEAAGLDIGGAPSDSDLQALAASYRVDGIVNLGTPSVAEQAAAASLGQAYLRLAVPPGAGPTWPQLRALAGFLRRHTARGSAVYLHDDAGGGRAVTTADMLLLLRGEAWSKVSRGMTTAQLQSLSDGQLLAINQLVIVLHPAGNPPAGNPYAAARLDPW
jgi:hypothetical protein